MQKTKIPRLTSARGLFDILEEALEDWEKAPDEQGEKDFLFLCFGLAHLGEWIVGSGKKRLYQCIKKMAQEDRSPAQKFYYQLWDVPDFQIVRGICDASKHFTLERVDRVTGEKVNREPETSFETGADIGADFPMSFTRDFMIDGRSATEIFEAVLEQYRRWFTEGGDGAS